MDSNGSSIRMTRRQPRRAALTACAAACIGSLALGACSIDFDLDPSTAQIPPLNERVFGTKFPLTDAPDAGAGSTQRETTAADDTATDRFRVGDHFDALVFVARDIGYGQNLFYYLRRDPARENVSTLGTMSSNGAMIDRFEVGKDFDLLTFAADPAVAAVPR